MKLNDIKNHQNEYPFLILEEWQRILASFSKIEPFWGDLADQSYQLSIPAINFSPILQDFHQRKDKSEQETRKQVVTWGIPTILWQASICCMTSGREGAAKTILPVVKGSIRWFYRLKGWVSGVERVRLVVT